MIIFKASKQYPTSKEEKEPMKTIPIFTGSFYQLAVNPVIGLSYYLLMHSYTGSIPLL